MACKSEPKPNKESNTPQEEMTESEMEEMEEAEKVEEKKILVTSDDYFEDYKIRKEKLIEKLNTATPQFANYLYLDFRKENELMAQKLYELEMNMLDDYEGLYDDEGEISYKKYGNKIRKAESVGLEFWGVGEGMTEIRVEPREYGRIFKGKVTPDTEKFISLNQRDDEKLLTNDGGLSVSFEEMANIIIRWEKFIKENPKSNRKEEAKQMYETYQMWYLFGLDNTPTRDYELGQLYEENKTEMERFVQTYPNSPTTKLVKMVLESDLSTEDLVSQVSDLQNSILKQM